MNKTPEDPTLRLPSTVARLAVPLMGGGAVLLLVGVLLGALLDSVGMRFAMGAYLTAYMYCLTISLGALFFVIIQHLTRAGWSVTVRRLAELLMAVLPVMAILFLPIVATLWIGEGGTLYKWGSEEWVAEHHPEWRDPNSPQHSKGVYLSGWFFTIRSLVYLGIWAALGSFFYKLSRRQDETAERRLTERMQGFSGPAVILFALSLTFAAFDWLMSLEPVWFSTMFGVYIFSGGILTAICAVTVLTYLVQCSGSLRQEVTVEHYHDLGKLIFGFITFWTYIAFSQYMLIWYGNIPEETFWFGMRQTHGWATVSLALVAFHWLLPFLALLSRHMRRRPAVMFGWAAYLMVMHFIDMYWIVMPSVTESPAGGVSGLLVTLLCTFGMVGLYFGAVLRAGGDAPLIPVRDPRLGESLAFHNV